MVGLRGVQWPLGDIGSTEAATRSARDATAELIAALRPRAARPWQRPTSEDFHDYFATGERRTYDSRLEADHETLSALVLLHLLTPDPDLLQRIEEGLSILDSRAVWHLPAHERDKPAPGHRVDVGRNRSLDMVAAETAAVVAWAVHLFEDELAASNAGLVQRLRARALEDVVNRYVESDDAWIDRFVRASNWTPWIAHQVLATSALTSSAGVPERSVASRAQNSLQRYWDLIPTDGGVEEGFTYWWQGPAHFLEATALLSAAGFPLDLDRERLRRFVRFPLEVVVGSSSILTFSDADRERGDRLGWQLVDATLRSLGDANGSRRCRALAATPFPAPDITNPLERTLRSVADPGWATGDRSPDPARAGGASFESIGLEVSRSAGDPPWVLAATVGHNGQLHNHQDVGSFSVWIGDDPVVLDLGAPTYDASTFGPRRHEQFAVGSAWHSVPIVDGHGQGVGAQYRATATRRTRGSAGALRLETRVDAAYEVEGLNVWHRTLELEPNGPRVRVSDRWEWKPGSGGTAEVLVILPGQAAWRGDHVVVALPDHQVRITWTECAAARLERVDVDDPRVAEAWGPVIGRLVLEGPAGPSGSVGVDIALDAASAHEREAQGGGLRRQPG